MSNFNFNFTKPEIIPLLLAAAAALLLSSCYTTRVYHDTDLLRENHDDEISSISMIFNESQIDGPAQIRSACPSGASLIEIEQTLTDGLVHYLSLGLYSPHTIWVWCKRRIR
ncbi:MAG: hypothetical protein H8E38_04680 [SAR324 cluster bacterium]|nr:hypothetical protein [SAR324 cluster bacterium]MBL7035082.1 hypothetical protein [SAR324 cluster bacterium]